MVLRQNQRYRNLDREAPSLNDYTESRASPVSVSPRPAAALANADRAAPGGAIPVCIREQALIDMGGRLAL